jgi:predicted oxidoreductase
MKTIPIGKEALPCSRLAFGCWRIAGTWNSAEVTAASRAAGVRAIQASYEAGYTLYDHADIYCDGIAESIFADALKSISGMRERVIIATKCGIRKCGEPKPDAPFRYDFSADHILHSCDHSLRRLGVETIDIYQLHRPDYLMDPQEVAAAFDKLVRTGKVREFGVSNFKPSQVTALQRACPMPLVVNQVEISLAMRDTLDDGTLDQCLAENMIPLAWSPLGGGLLGQGATRLLPWQEGYETQRVVTAIDQLAKARGTTRSVIALAWLLKHPAKIIPIVGSTNPDRIREATQADAFAMSREEWYSLLEAARGERLP